MNAKPIGNRILIAPERTSEKSEGGIYLSQASQEVKPEADVIEIGTGEDIKVKVGDRIIFEKGTNGTVIGDYVLINYSSVIATIVPD